MRKGEMKKSVRSTIISRHVNIFEIDGKLKVCVTFSLLLIVMQETANKDYQR